MSLPKTLQNIDSIETNIDNIEDGTTTVGSATTATTAGSCTGNAATATTLATARTIQTNLASSSSASFNGSANITPGVTGVLPVANGGTGSSTEKYLPLSGGILSGALSFSSNDVTIRNTGSNANIYLFPNSRSDFEGKFIIQAGTNDNDYKRLLGTPSGSLTWNSKEIERVDSSGINYIRFASGLQICWGEIEISALASGGHETKAVAFPLAFYYTPQVVSTGATNAGMEFDTHFDCYRNTTSLSLDIYNNGGSAWVNTKLFSWVAIGRWW